MKIIFIIIAIIILALVFKFRFLFDFSNDTDKEFNEAVLENIKDSQLETEAQIKLNREKLSSFPVNVSGMVSFTHHIGSTPGEEMFWLEEYGDLEFFSYSDLYDEIGIEEDKKFTFVVIEKEDKKLWIASGNKL